MNRTRQVVLAAIVALAVAACTRGLTDASTPGNRVNGPALSSTPGCGQTFNTVMIGPHSNDADILVDGSFEKGCPDWTFGDAAAIRLDTFSTRERGAAELGSTFAQMKPYTSFTKTKIFQDVNLVNPANGKKELPNYVTFFVNTISSSGSSAFDQYTVKLINPANNAVLQTLSTKTALVPASWALYSFHLTQPLSYYPNTVRLQFEGTVMDAGTRFQFDNVQFWATMQ
jgi:hypothetical protein